MIEDWVQIELGKALTIERGGSPRPIKEYITDSKDGINWIKIGDTKINSKYITSTAEKIKPEGLKKTRLVNEGDLLLSNSMSFGRPYILATNGAIHDGWLVLKNKTHFKIDSEYLYYVLSSPIVFAQFDKLATGSTVRNLNTGLVSRVVTPIAPLPIQRAIVTKIENLFASLDKGIADLKKVQEQLKIYRQSVLKKAFEGGFVNDCSNWKHVKISTLCEVVRGGSPRPAGDSKYYDGKIPFLKVADLTRNEGTHLKTYTYSIKEAGLKKTRLVKANTLLLSNSGATLGIPKICSFETTFNDGIAAFLGLEEETLLYHYYFWLSKTKELRNINQGAAQPNLNTNMIGVQEIPICSPEDQKQTVQEIESRLSVCDKVEQSIIEGLEKSEALRQSILKKAFEGKLLSETEIEKCKQEADYEPASVLLERIKKVKNNL